MRSMPEPTAHELSEEFWEAPVSPSLESLGGVLPGISCRLPVLPSGRALSRSISNSPGLMFYGRLLRGGVRRYRLQADSTGGARARRKRLVESSVQRALREDADYLVQYGVWIGATRPSMSYAVRYWRWGSCRWRRKKHRHGCPFGKIPMRAISGAFRTENNGGIAFKHCCDGAEGERGTPSAPDALSNVAMGSGKADGMQF